jgi:hypothetical protein
MKDPILVSTRQIDEMHRLLKYRIAPSNDPLRRCQSDTAGKAYVGNSKRINVTRPLQSTNAVHYMVFCECRWVSRFVEDQAWCANNPDQLTRLYKHPYNFPTNGF